jgi:Tfp pilus assembly protein PilF
MVLPLVLSLRLLSLSAHCQDKTPDRTQVESHLRQAQIYLQQKRPALAIPEFESAVALDPNNVDAQGNLGVLLFFDNRYSDAIPHLRAASLRRPELWKLHALLGLAECKASDRVHCRADLESTVPTVTDAKLRSEVGRTLIEDYIATAELEKAAAMASTLLTYQPTDPAILYISYRLYSDLANKTALSLALTSPKSAQMHWVMARELSRHGDTSAAIANYREAIQLDPQLPGIQSELADLLFHSSTESLRAEAEDHFMTAIKINTDDEHAYFMLGLIAEWKGDTADASSRFSRALEIDPNDTDACTEMGKLLLSQDKTEEAQKFFEKAVETDPASYAAHYQLGIIYHRAGRDAESKEQIALYLKYKQLKSDLEKVFNDMRIVSAPHPDERLPQ